SAAMSTTISWRKLCIVSGVLGRRETVVIDQSSLARKGRPPLGTGNLPFWPIGKPDIPRTYCFRQRIQGLGHWRRAPAEGAAARHSQASTCDFAAAGTSSSPC